MPTSTTFPNGQVLTSSALTQDEINGLFQSLTTQMLGIAPDHPKFNSTVRIDWPTEGQPAFRVDEDICFLAITEMDGDYNRIRNVEFAPTDDPTTLNEQTSYTRIWQVGWTLYGPNSTDRARLLRSALFTQFASETLASSALYLVPDIAAAVRIPEQFQGRWWERVDLKALFNEGVTETVGYPQVSGVEIEIHDRNGLEREFEIDR